MQSRWSRSAVLLLHAVTQAPRLVVFYLQYFHVIGHLDGSDIGWVGREH